MTTTHVRAGQPAAFPNQHAVYLPAIEGRLLFIVQQEALQSYVLQVEELLDLFLGPGAPWPPRKNAPVTQRPSARPWSSPGRLEPAPRDGHAYNEHATSRGFAADHRPMLEGPSYRDRSELYIAE